MKSFNDKLNEALELHKKNNIQKALEIYLELAQFNENDLNLQYLIGNCYIQKDNFQLATNHFIKALKINNKHFPSLNNLGGAFFQLNRFDDAIKIFNKILKHEKNNSNAKNNIANCYAALRKYKHALKIYQNLIQENSNDFIAYNNIGNIYKNLNKYDDAIKSYKKSLEINKKYVLPLYNLGELLSKLGEYKESIKMYEEIKFIDPNYKDIFSKILHVKQKICDWNDYDELKLKIVKDIKNNKSINPFILLSLYDDPEIQKNCAENYINQKFKNKILDIKKIKNFNKKPKIAYFSSDFKNHPVLHLSFDIFKNHNRSKFDTFAFSLSKNKEDNWNYDIKNHFNAFFEIFDKSDEEIIKLSNEIGIDIAIDLNGFTDKGRQGIFLNRVAPIQINFLGYPGTMGSELYDFIIVDETIIPENQKKNYSEKIIYQTNCYQPNMNKRKISEKKFKKSDFGIPEDHFVFCNFNSNYKITPKIFNVWIEILKEVKNSILWIYSNNDNVEINLKKEAEKKNFNSERIIFAKKLKIEEHLKRIQLADIFLDTYPYTAHTTGSDAIRVGLPLITIKGKSFASRVASSLLNQVNLNQLACSNIEEYKNLAIKIGKNKDYFNKIKKELSSSLKKTLLFDSKKFTKNLEDIYINILKKNEKN
mgnify:CR=1 FL=1|tara:strand:+ start:69 stop:2015 length:1947 start_codon:yes stop_codon:yes gene_type:complete